MEPQLASLSNPRAYSYGFASTRPHFAEPKMAPGTFISSRPSTSCWRPTVCE